MARLLTTLILIIDILVIIDIVRSAKDTERKVLWIIAVVFLPILGPILYLLLGRK